MVMIVLRALADSSLYKTSLFRWTPDVKWRWARLIQEPDYFWRGFRSQLVSCCAVVPKLLVKITRVVPSIAELSAYSARLLYVWASGVERISTDKTTCLKLARIDDSGDFCSHSNELLIIVVTAHDCYNLICVTSYVPAIPSRLRKPISCFDIS
jgi:hypothetical protein